MKFLWSRRRLDDEAAEELRTHLELLTERYIDEANLVLWSPGWDAASDIFWESPAKRFRVRLSNAFGATPLICPLGVRRTPPAAAIATPLPWLSDGRAE